MNARAVAFRMAGPIAVLLPLLFSAFGCGHGKGAGAAGAPASPGAAPVQLDVPAPAGAAGRAIERAQAPGAALANAAPPVPQSRVAATLRVSLAGLAAQLDAALPRSHAEDYRRLTAEGQSPRIDARVHIERDPVGLRLRGQRLELSVPVRYWADLRGEVRSPIAIGKRRWYPLASGLTWGTKQAPQRLTLRASVALTMDGDRGVALKTELQPLQHGAPPEGNVCVQAGIRFCTPKRGFAPLVRSQIDRALEPHLQQAAAALEGVLGSGPSIAALWGQLGCPLSLSTRRPTCAPPAGNPDDTYLMLAPEQVVLQGPQQDGDALLFRVAVLGGAAVRFGAHPGSGASPLPVPGRGTVAEGVDLGVQLQVLHAAAARELLRRLADFSYDIGGGRALQVRDATVEARVDAAGVPRLLLHLRLVGAVEGGIYLWGTPHYDAGARELVLSELQYTLETDDRFVAALETMNHARFRQALQARARYPLGPELDRLQAALQEELGSLSLPGLRVAARLQAPSLGQPVLAADRSTLLLSLRGSLDLHLADPGRAVQTAAR